MNETNERTNSSNALERVPSALSTDCPIETCLEFSVVDYWGNPVTSPSKFELDGKPVQPDTPIFNLASRDHILKAVDGEELRKQILNFPSQPIKTKPFPAKLLADKKKYKFIPADKDNIWRGIPLTTSPNEKCCKYVIEVDQGIDYYILMVFLDNHSGHLHGTGHAGLIIINGETQNGLYSHFGPYYSIDKEFLIYSDDDNDIYFTQTDGLGQIENYEINYQLLCSQNGSLNESRLASIFSYINDNYGSGIYSNKFCKLKKIFKGPAHENIYSDSFPIYPGFDIDGLIAWAAYVLPYGSYKHMEKYITTEDKKIREMLVEEKDAYGPYNNCMTYSLYVLYKGLNIDKKPGARGLNVDHPNAHIQDYMLQANDCGIYDDRILLRMPDSTHKRIRPFIQGIKHHKHIKFVFSDRVIKTYK